MRGILELYVEILRMKMIARTKKNTDKMRHGKNEQKFQSTISRERTENHR